VTSWQTQIKPVVALLQRYNGSISLEILLEPFVWQGELVKTSIRLDSVNIPSVYLRDLVGRSFDFPRNPLVGYIDGSIYVEDTHHYVDVTQMVFHRSRLDTATVVLRGFFCGTESGHEGVPFVLNAPLASLAI
jgi:hypothetical protein